jgi:FAD/FMN-containing dehydrogenase
MNAQSAGDDDLSTQIAPDRVHRPGAPHFDDAIRLWNGAVSHRPAMVAQPTSPNEVQTVLRYARAKSIAVSVRGGGHDWAGRALAPNGLVIDMSLMRQVSVDAETGVATLAGGALAADLVAAAEPHGLAPATGIIGDVGVVGLTLGGGYGPLIGIAGLALDNLLEVEIVLDGGRAVTANADDEPDLFWALRGGGGNFGVVTSMRVQLHPVPQVTAGVIGFAWHEAAAVLRKYNALMSTVPDELTVPISVATGPGGGPVLFLWPTWSGPAESSSAWMERLTGLGTPILTQVGPMVYSQVLQLIAPFIVWGRHHEMRTRNLRTYGSGAIDALIRAADSRTSELSGISIHHFHGAATRVPVERTAFGIREPHFMVEVLAAWEPGEDGTPHRNWADAVYTDLGKYAIDGGYPSLIGPDQAAQAEAAYGPNATHLLEVKRRYDPANTFSATPLPTAGRATTRGTMAK